MQKFTCLVIGGLIIMLSGCSANPPSGLVKAYGDKGWSKVGTQGAITVWRNSMDQGSYVLTKGENILAVVPTHAENDWIEVYANNRIAINVNIARKRVWNRSGEVWDFTKDPTEQPDRAVTQESAPSAAP